MTALPTLDINRPHVFLDVSQRGKPVGRLIVELFEDLYPVVCAAFRHRCLEGFNTLKGSKLHSVQPQYAVFGGLLQASAATPLPAAALAKRPLQHTQRGLLSVAHDGTQFAVTLSRALPLDSGYKVIGRVGKGAEVLADLNEVDTDVEGNPEHPLTIVQCGTTDHRGLNESLSQAAAAGNATGAVDAMRGSLASTSAGVMDAVSAGLKRKTGAAAGSERGGGAVAAASDTEAAAKRAKSAKGKAFVLDDLGSDDSDEDGDADAAGAAA